MPFTRNIDYSKYYNDLIGPIDVSGIYEPEDFETAEEDKIQWLIYNKPKCTILQIAIFWGNESDF